MPLYILTCKIKWSNIGNRTIEKIIIILFLKWSNFDVKNLLSVFSTIIKTNNSNKLKIGNLNIKKLKKYVLGVLSNPK